MLRKTVSFILLFLISINLCACSPNEPTPEEVVEKLETAFNTSNIDMMLECYEPSVQNMYKGLMELGGQALGGIDLETVINGLGGFADVFGSEIGYEMPTVHFIINDRKVISETKVKMNITQIYKYNSANHPKNAPDKITSDMYFVKIDGKWYISAKK